LAENAKAIITGSFPNLSAVCDYITDQKQNVILACAAWKDKVNLEDTLFAGAVINRVKNNFSINCDASNMAETLYVEAKDDMYEFMKKRNASHYHRLINFGLEKDIRYCLTTDVDNILPIYKEGRLVVK
jgi:2-phosphosulfolactate phosphatase